MRRIAVYGKGGIGKSTTVSNVASALVQKGLRVMQIGCDPKADSTCLHGGGDSITVLDAMRTYKNPDLKQVVRQGDDGVICVECGGPIPGTGCAGRGIVTAFDYLAEHDAYEIYKPDVVLYDVLGDVVCGGFALPMRGEYAKNVFIVTSGEKMALFAAGNIAMALDHFKSRGYARLTGVIQNSRNVEDEDRLVQEMADGTGVPVTMRLPRDPRIAEAERQNRTAVAAFPDSDTARNYFQLAERMLDATEDV